MTSGTDIEFIDKFKRNKDELQICELLEPGLRLSFDSKHQPPLTTAGYELNCSFYLCVKESLIFHTQAVRTKANN